MKLVKSRDRRSQATTANPCYLLALPAEIRLFVYSYIAPDGFLPNAPCKTYIGLLLSYPQIYNEMTSEAVPLAPFILRTIQFSVNATPMKLQPLRPTSFASLMHLTIGIPHWAMLDQPTMMGILIAMAPVPKLHLARLTIGLEDLEGEDDILQMVETVNPETNRAVYEPSTGHARIPLSTKRICGIRLLSHPNNIRKYHWTRHVNELSDGSRNV